MPSFLESCRAQLNDEQLEAVSSVNGPLLVLAGAGSGKTRVLTYRIAHLVYDLGVPLHSILAMTFSNKAAREMHDRVKVLLGDSSEFRLPWISTFHSVCARLLRNYGERLGYKSDYVIYDESEQIGIVKDCLEKLKISDKEVSADSALHRIGQWKNEGKFWEDIQDQCATRFDEVCGRVYRAYRDEMLNAQAMDFDDLLLNTYRLFHDHEDIRNYFQNHWKYILVDEFQDTNVIQYKLLQQFINPDRNICVVGDDDQSIYGWRGAEIENILNFDKEYSSCRVVKLEQNYRSTGNILKAAASVISKNELRHAKTLWTASIAGPRIAMAALEDDRAEAFFVVSEIKRLIRDGVSPTEIAVFYRVNSLSRGFEEECLRQRIAYQIIGGFRFYERKEIKDILSYFKILLNPSDVMAFRRTVNTPLRGIGKTSIDKIEEAASQSHEPIIHFLSKLENLPVTGKAKSGLASYIEYVKWGLQAIEGSESLVDLFIDGIKRTRYMEMLEAQKNEESQDRLENIQELLSAVQEFEETWQPAQDLPATGSVVRQKLRDFLERVSLIADVDSMEATQADQITFMSLHSAKGLEFKVCFISGMEEGLFPTARSFDSYQRTEEERRLCYVGITRAREKLYLTRAGRRRTFGSINFNVASRFLKDIPKDVLESIRDETQSYESSSYGYYGKKKIWGGGDVESDDIGWDDSPIARRASADYEFDQRVPDDDSFQFKKGDRVAHPSFGDGIVQKSELLGTDECLSIVFAGKGMKKVLAKFVSKR